MIGTQVGHFRVRQKLGEGGMGEVFLAEDTRLERQVALKFLPPYLTKDPEFRSRFEHEAKAAAALNHPNIVTVHELNEHEGRLFIAMEYVEGESLEALIKRGDLSIARAIQIVQQVCEGLHEAHEAGIVHRDIKPSNILIDTKGRARILDFGLAKSRKATAQTKTGTTLGTLQYESPEQVSGEPVDARSDLFSLGAVFYELITGRTPFAGEFEEAIRYSILHDDPEPLARYKSGELGELQRIVGRTLAKDPRLRYQSAADLLAELKALHTPQAALAPTLRPRWPWMIAAAAIVVLAGFLVIERFIDRAGGSKADWTDSVAVMVFRDLSPEKDQDWFCEGMTTEIISRLHAIGRLKVTSIQSMLRFKDSDKDLKQIGKELGVEHIVQGSVLKDRDSIRVRAQLLRVDDDTPLWSDRYDHEVTSILAVHDEISQAITDVLKLKLSGDEATALIRKGTESVDAHNSFMQGHYFLRKRTVDGIRAAIAHFRRAIESDSEFALAWSGLADAWAVLPDFALETVPGHLDSARRAAQRALELDSLLAEAHASMGLILEKERDIAGSIAELENALVLNPNYVWAHVWYGNVMARDMRRKDVKIEHLHKALQLDPLNIVALNNMGNVLSDSGLYEEAESHFLKLVEVVPEMVTYQVHFARHYKRAGNIDKFIAQYERAIEIDPDLWYLYNYYAVDLLDMDRRDDAIAVYDRAVATYPDSAGIHLSYGRFLYSNLGHSQAALAQLTRAVELAPEHADARNLLAYVYIDLDDFGQALHSIDRALEISPNELNYVDTRGDVFYAFGFLDSAMVAYRRFLEQRPNHMRELRKLGDAATFARMYDAADSTYEALSDQFSTEDRGWGQLFRSRPLRHQGRFRETLELTGDCINIIRREVGPSATLGGIYWFRAQLYAAYLNDYRRALADLDTLEQLAVNLYRKEYIEPLLASVAAGRPWICAKQGDLVRTEYWLAQWDTIDIPNPDYWLAQVEMERGNFPEAVRLLEGVEDTARPAVDVWLWLGTAYLGNNQFQEAAERITKSISRYDDEKGAWHEQYVWAHYKLGTAYEGLGDTARAIEQYETFLDIWRNADPDLESVVDARARLARLKGERG